jgi:uncharacterized coiled-coil protein SlyX
MTKKLEELFGFDKLEQTSVEMQSQTVEETRSAIVEIDNTIDKINDALPAVRDLDSSDKELDDIAAKATETFDNLTDLGFNVDSRYAAELFAVAGTMLGHALTAKQTKLQKKLKVIELQMKKLKLDQDAAKSKGGDIDIEQAEGKVLSRNDLLEMLKAPKE